MPTVQGTSDFNHPIDSANYDQVFGSPQSVSSPLYQSQPRSLQIASAGQNIGVRKNLTGAPARGWVGFPFRYVAAPTGGDVVVLGFLAANGGIARLSLGGTGLYATVADQLGAQFAVSPDTWYWVEAIFDCSGATNALHFRVEGVDGASASKVVSASTVDYNQLVSLSGNGLATWYAGMWKWGSAASASDWLGEPVAGTEVAADFVLPWEIMGVDVPDTLGELPTTASVVRVWKDLGRTPTSADGSSAGYSVGDVWIHGSIAWWCVSAAVSAAVWKQVTS